jgi:hypothetical protein
MANVIKLRIEAESGNLGPFDQVQGKLKGMTKAAEDFVSALKAGVGIDLGGKLVSSLQEIPRVLQEAVASGVRFNAELESAQLGIAAIYKQFATDKFPTFDAAAEGAGKAVDALREKAAMTSATFSDLLGAYQSTVGTLYAAGINDLKRQVDTVGLLANAVAAVVSDKSQLVQETRAILTGNITSDAQAARTFGITSQDIATAKEAGQLYEFLEKKLSAFAEAGERSAGTFDVAVGNLGETIKAVEAELTKPIFDALKAGVIALDAELQKPEVVNGLRAIGFEVTALVKGGAELLKWAINNASALQSLAHGATTLGAALAAMALSKLVTGLGAWGVAIVTTAIATARSTAALGAETAALAANTAAQAANATARGANTAAGGAGAVGQSLRAGVNTLPASVAGAGIPIGAAIYAYRVQKAGEETAAAQANDALLDSFEKQRRTLEEQLRSATDLESKANARKSIEEQILSIKQQMNSLDDDGQGIARRAIFNLEFMAKRVDKLAGTAKPGAPGVQDSDPNALREWNAANSRADTSRAIREIGMSPAELLEQRQGHAKELRDNIAYLLSEKGAATSGDFKMEEALGNVEKSTFNAEGKSGMLDLLKELAALEKDITAETQKQGEDLDANMARESKRFLENQELLADLREELGIQKESTAGHDDEAKVLEIRRDLRKEIATITASELSAADKARAIDLATQTAELQKQLVAQKDLAASQSPIGDRPEGRGYRDAEGRWHIKRQGFTDGAAKNVTPDSGFDDFFKAAAASSGHKMAPARRRIFWRSKAATFRQARRRGSATSCRSRGTARPQRAKLRRARAGCPAPPRPRDRRRRRPRAPPMR